MRCFSYVRVHCYFRGGWDVYGSVVNFDELVVVKGLWRHVLMMNKGLIVSENKCRIRRIIYIYK